MANEPKHQEEDQNYGQTDQGEMEQTNLDIPREQDQTEQDQPLGENQEQESITGDQT